jgi:hypothetical protein
LLAKEKPLPELTIAGTNGRLRSVEGLIKASAWNFELFPNPVFVMRIISRIHVDDLRDLVRKDSGDDQTLNLSLKG